MLYALDIGGQTVTEVERWYVQTNPLSPDAREFAGRLLDRFSSEHTRIEQLITRYLKDWRLERLSAIDRSLLKLATAELLLDTQPVAVVISEALRLASKFSQPEALKLTNAVLDAIATELHPKQSRDRTISGVRSNRSRRR